MPICIYYEAWRGGTPRLWLLDCSEEKAEEKEDCRNKNHWMIVTRWEKERVLSMVVALCSACCEKSVRRLKRRHVVEVKHVFTRVV
jgi:hypothetical protein